MKNDKKLSYSNQLVLAAEKKAITSEEAQAILGCGMTAARMTVRKLWVKGLLERKPLSQSSGGLYYIYTLAKSGHSRVAWLHNMGY